MTSHAPGCRHTVSRAYMRHWCRPQNTGNSMDPAGPLAKLQKNGSTLEMTLDVLTNAGTHVTSDVAHTLMCNVSYCPTFCKGKNVKELFCHKHFFFYSYRFFIFPNIVIMVLSH